MKVTKGRLWLRTVADCKEQTRCLSSLALLSKESMIVGKVQTWPTAQHELHRRSLLCWILAKSVAPCLCRVHGRCSVGPKLIVFRDPGVLKWSDFICLHWKQCFVFLPGLSNDKGSMSCQITEGIVFKEEFSKTTCPETRVLGLPSQGCFPYLIRVFPAAAVACGRISFPKIQSLKATQHPPQNHVFPGSLARNSPCIWSGLVFAGRTQHHGLFVATR